MFLKRRQALYEIPTPEAYWTEGFFQIQAPNCGDNFSNNVSMTKVRVNDRKTNMTRPLKLLNY